MEGEALRREGVVAEMGLKTAPSWRKPFRLGARWRALGCMHELAGFIRLLFWGLGPLEARYL